MPPSWVSSSFLLFVILISGAFAVGANIWYQAAKAREAKADLASNAKAILLPEVKRNGDLISSMQAALTKGQVPLEKFDVTAWETISKGGLLLGLDPAETNKFLNAYRLAYQANDLSAQILDLTVGVRSALSSANQTKSLYLNSLKITLEELQAAFSELGVKPGRTG